MVSAGQTPDAQRQHLPLGPPQLRQRGAYEVQPGGVVHPPGDLVGEVPYGLVAREAGDGRRVSSGRAAGVAGDVGGDAQ